MAASRSPKVAREAAAVDANTTFVQADPATFRALVQKLTGAAPAAGGTTTATATAPKQEDDDDAAAVTVAHAPRRPKLQERRRAAPARLELSPASASLYCYHHHSRYGHGLIMHSPVSPMDAYMVLAASASPSPSPSPSSGGAVVTISREEEEREEKAIASKGFYLHASPRGGDGDRPRLLPLFPVHSPRISELRRG
uniref:DNA-binding WRKY n=1 Tax=Zea mays TaxID=4577 RepID=B6U2X0_MAIZE|nr:DNA-binding WRKY [Zea mays]